MRNLALSVAAGILISGCAYTYKPPQVSAVVPSRVFTGSQEALMEVAQQALTTSGYQITSVDKSAGTISTAPLNFHLSPADANCGTTMGLDYLKDNRTSTTVRMGVVIQGGNVKVIGTMSGTYLPSDDVQSITLTCVSRGVLENQLLDRIQSDIKLAGTNG